jgi:hypothetical protein
MRDVGMHFFFFLHVFFSEIFKACKNFYWAVNLTLFWHEKYFSGMQVLFSGMQTFFGGAKTFHPI